MTTRPSRPEASEPVTGPALRTITVAETAYTLYDEGGGCLALIASHPSGLLYQVERRCFQGEQVVALSDSCGWLADPVTTVAGDCDIALPRVFFGQTFTPDIGYVCIGTIEPTNTGVEVTSARFLSLDDDGYILDAAQPDETPPAHLFTPGGIRYGFPPLDAPSDPIYTFCEEQAPWGTTEYSIPVRLFVVLDEPLRSDDMLVVVDPGSGRVGMSGAAASDGQTVDLPLVVAASSSGLAVTVAWAQGDSVEFFRSWPDQFRALLDGGGPCHLSTSLRLTITAAALEGSEDAVTLTLQSLCG